MWCWLTYSSGFESKQELLFHYEHLEILDEEVFYPYIAEMVYPHHATLFSALDLPLISSHEPTCHGSPDESEDRMMCNLNSGERDEVIDLCINLHKLFLSLFFSETHGTVLPIYHHHIHILFSFGLKYVNLQKNKEMYSLFKHSVREISWKIRKVKHSY